MSHRYPDEEKPLVTSFTISDVSWDSLQLSWEALDGAFQAFLVKVTDAETGSEVQNRTVVADARSFAVSDLSAATWYRVSLYGLHRGALLGPVTADTITGSNVTAYPPLSFFFYLLFSISDYLTNARMRFSENIRSAAGSPSISGTKKQLFSLRCEASPLYAVPVLPVWAALHSYAATGSGFGHCFARVF